MKLSHSQLSYIAAIDALKPLGATQTNISEFLNVKRPSANVALKLLTQKEYIVCNSKHKTLEYSLTEKGKAALSQMQHERSVFFTHFVDFVGIDEEIVEEQYHSVLSVLNPNFVEKMSTFQNSGFKKLPSVKKPFVNRSVFPNRKNGTYTVPFQVHKLGDSSASMGNKGFVHPAKIILHDHNAELWLESRIFYHKSAEGKMLKGYLKSLSYYSKNEWHTAEIREDHIFIIPLKYIMYQNNDLGHPEMGQIKIQAKSSSKHMPVSIAEITFNFSLMEEAETS